MILCNFFVLTTGGNAYSQKRLSDINVWYKKARYFTIDSAGITIYRVDESGCKLHNIKSKHFNVQAALPKSPPIAPKEAPKTPFLQLHGNISYTFDYRSQLDTPFAATNFQQHNEQVYADATLKNRYPFRVILNSRQSNSPYFKNYTDVNIQFNHQAYQQMVKQEMIDGIAKKKQMFDSIANCQALLDKQRNAYAVLQNWLGDPARMQEMVQEKEQLYGKYMQSAEQNALNGSLIKKALKNGEDSIKTPAQGGDSAHKKWSMDSLTALLQMPTSIEKKMRSAEKTLDSLGKAMQQTQHRADSISAGMGSDIADQENKIRNASSAKDLENIAKQSGRGPLSKFDKSLLAVTQFGIGRSSLNYSELTVNNVSLTGVNIEYNPSYYAAFAAGSVDYIFRDFVLQPANMPKQNLVLGRFGWGNIEKQVLIFTAYSGTKNNFGGNVTDTASLAPQIHTTNIFGYSLEAKQRVGKNAEASFEFAKSSAPYNSSADKSKSFGSAFAFSDHNNEAWSAKLDLSIPQLKSSLNLTYKSIGPNFQSYSIYNTGNRQQAWNVKWRQYFFKSQLSLTVQVRHSMVDDPLIPLTYNSAITFKSVQAVYRKRKWPVFSVGYMPSTQLIKSSDGTLHQSIYYAFTASMLYSYTLLHLKTNSSLVYSRFYNKGTDSGFVLYNAQSILYSHNIDMGMWHSQTDAQYTGQPGLNYWTFQQIVDVRAGKYLTIGAGLKNNIIPLGNIVDWGGMLQIGVQVKQIGGLRLQYNKDYLPDGNGNLVPNNWGRAVWYKVF